MSWTVGLSSRVLLIALLSAGCSEGAGTAVTDACGPAGRSPASLGLNLSAPAPWLGDRAFMNLLVGAQWFSVRPGVAWSALPLERLTAEGLPSAILPGEDIAIGLTPPYGSTGAVRIQCRYSGSAKLEVGGAAKDVWHGAGLVRFTWPMNKVPPEGVWLKVKGPADGVPLRIADCREQGADPDALFHPDYVGFLKPFSVIRFMDWGHTNKNLPVTSATRTTPRNIIQRGPDGIALEHRFALANEVGRDAWIALPWNADDSYLREAARLAVARLPRGRKLYIEAGNEVWNYGFPVAAQAKSEGQERGLASPQMHRYAQRSKEMFAIFSEAFKDRPKDLVRVISTQNANPRTAEEALSYPGIAEVTDALATAPYFGHNRRINSAADVGPTLFNLESDLQETLELAQRNKAIARKHGLRFIAYEGGQHVVGPDIESAKRLQRDPAMEHLYRDYLKGWRRLGDVMVLWVSTSPVAHYGAFGLREWAGQDPAETPKLRAVSAYQRDCGSSSHSER